MTYKQKQKQKPKNKTKKASTEVHVSSSNILSCFSVKISPTRSKPVSPLFSPLSFPDQRLEGSRDSFRRLISYAHARYTVASMGSYAWTCSTHMLMHRYTCVFHMLLSTHSPIISPNPCVSMADVSPLSCRAPPLDQEATERRIQQGQQWNLAV